MGTESNTVFHLKFFSKLNRTYSTPLCCILIYRTLVTPKHQTDFDFFVFTCLDGR